MRVGRQDIALQDFAVYAAAVLTAVAVSGCAGNQTQGVAPTASAPPVQPEIPASIGVGEVVGRWGYGSYHRAEDMKRTAAAARSACGDPVTIDRGPNGGVMMYLADSPQLRELVLKGSASGQNYLGPPGPAGGPQDREISFDGHTMVLKWMDPEVDGRYGTGVYVHCPPAGTHVALQKPKKPKPKPKPKQAANHAPKPAESTPAQSQPADSKPAEPKPSATQ